jgi:predicted ATP-grasp superfamily ATP-dependent carboligase
MAAGGATVGPGAVVVGGYANAVGVVRALGLRGVRVAVVLTMPQDIAHLSRYASEHHRVPDIGGDPDFLLDILEGHARRWLGWAVIPTNDHALEVLARERDRLTSTYRLPVPPWELTRLVLDKRLTRSAAVEVGIDVPRSLGSAAAAGTRLEDIDYPVVVKPIEGHRFAERVGRKLLLARDRAELDRAVAEADASGVACEIQELIPGPDDLHHDYQTYRTAAGDFVGDFALRKLRQSPPFFGVARAAEPAQVPELREQTYELLRRLDWQGFASVCYKRDPRTGRFQFMEVNGRCVLVHGLARRAGVDIPFMIYSGAARGEPLGIHPNGWNGVWIHLHADLLYTMFGGRAEGLDWGAVWRSYRRPKTFAVWSIRDPAPFLAQWGHTVCSALRQSDRRRMLDRVQLPWASGLEGFRGGPLATRGVSRGNVD